MSACTIRINKMVLTLLLSLVSGLPSLASAGTLYLGTDSSIGGPGVLGIFTTSGAAVTAKTSVTPADGRDFNGVGEGIGLTGIVTGGWGREFDTRNLAGSMISQSNNFFTPPTSVNEDFAGNGIEVWRAVYGPSIYLLNADGSTNATHTLSGANGLVGLTFAGSQLWASDFNTGTVGIVDTTLNTYTAMFTPGDLPAEVVGLAYDAAGGVLWVGSTGVIAPFNLAGLRLGANVDTTMQLGGGASIDGLAFIASVPEPGTLALFGVGLIAVLAKRGRR